MATFKAKIKPSKPVNAAKPPIPSSIKWGWLCGLSILFAIMACNLPLTSAPPNRTPLPAIIWWTNTPDPNQTPEAFPIASVTPTGIITSDPPIEATLPLSLNTPVATIAANAPPVLYYTQAGDTLPAVAVRFSVQPEEIYSPDPLPATHLLPPNQLLVIPRRLANTTSPVHLLPDSEIVYSPSAVDFNIEAYVSQAGGYLSRYHEYLNSTGNASGADIIQMVAIQNSINPRLLLALLEYQSGWVFGEPSTQQQRDYPLGYINNQKKGLYRQLAWAVNQLSKGFYGWREGLLTELSFQDGVIARLAPDLNAGTVALQYFFMQLDDAFAWVKALDADTGFVARDQQMFGNPWLRAVEVEPLYPPDLTQPPLILPFIKNQYWHFTGGPHGAWEHDGARAALDFAPSSSKPGCATSYHWITAAAPGLVVRTGTGLVMLDLDGDGHEQTGWDLLYLHIDALDSIKTGVWVQTGDKLGHPSCLGGVATGTHLHFARKYNGEWIPADGPLPFQLSGWIAHAGDKIYEGTISKDDQTIEACPCGSLETMFKRTDDLP